MVKKPAIFNDPLDSELIKLIRAGAVGVLPTDTVYGLVSSAYKQDAVTRMYVLKQREAKPGSTIVANIEQLVDLGIVLEDLAEVSRYWPGALSVILKPADQFEYIHQGVGDSPFRVVEPSDLRALLLEVGPLVTTSANPPGNRPAQSLSEARAYFGDKIDFYVDGGYREERPPSTIVRINDDGSLRSIRQGAVKLAC